MRFTNSILGALAAATPAVARVAPQRTVAPIFPAGNETKSIAQPTEPSCTADCKVRYPELQAISWVPKIEIVYTTEIIVGTVSVYTTLFPNNTSPARTRTRTGFNANVPPEYSLWEVQSNGFGTAFLEVPLTISGSHTLKTLVYPTPWLDYPSEYQWEGVLPTTGKRAEPVCVTASELDVGVLSLHPVYPQPTPSVDETDPEGASHQPLWIPVPDTPDKKWFDATFPSVSAFASCESTRGKPAPTQHSAAKFIFETVNIVTNFTTISRPIWLTTETGFENTKTMHSPTSGHKEITETGFDSSTHPRPSSTQWTGPHFMSTASGFDDIPDAHQTAPVEITDKPGTQGPGSTTFNNVKPPVSKPNGGPDPPVTAVPAIPKSTPVFTLIPTIIDGKPTASPAFILPGSSVVASIGQSVVVNGEPTVLAPPAAVYTMVPTIVDGTSTSKPVYIISGSITATIGQTVTIDDQSTVLSAPSPVLTMIATSISGVPTSIPAYIISGSITAFPGQTVTVDGQPIVLPTPAAIFESISTTIDGVETVIPAYIISGSITATIGQTVTIDGTTTVLTTPTGTDAIITQFGGPATTSGGGEARETTSSRGGGVQSSEVTWQAVMVGLGAFAVTVL